MTDRIVWRRLDVRGHETAQLVAQSLSGTAEFEHEGGTCLLNYIIKCDSRWHTLSTRVHGSVKKKQITIEIAVDSSQRWHMNGEDQPQVTGCIDVDLNFSPSTNLLPIRRLGLAVGEEAKVRAAWLRFPSFTLEPLEQIYRRIGENIYHYESGGGTFVRDLKVNSAGFVLDYPGLWIADAGQPA